MQFALLKDRNKVTVCPWQLAAPAPAVLCGALKMSVLIKLQRVGLGRWWEGKDSGCAWPQPGQSRAALLLAAVPGQRAGGCRPGLIAAGWAAPSNLGSAARNYNSQFPAAGVTPCFD